MRSAGLAAVLWIAVFQVALPASAAGPELVCGIANVEDLVALPGSPWIIGSGMGDALFQGGGLHLIHEKERSARKVELELSPGLAPEVPYDGCSGPPAAEQFSSHGLGLIAAGDGSYRLFAVNHGGRESIEVFRVTPAEPAPRFRWIGCVPAPEHSMPNAVAPRSDGSLVMSATSAGGALEGVPEELAATTGAVFEWSPDSGWEQVPGSALPLNNGVELSADERWAYVVSWPDASVTHLPLDPALGPARKVSLDFFPDNIRRTHDGQLAVTGQVASIEAVGTCVMNDDPHCAIDYRSAVIDPETLEATRLYDGKGTRDFGLATTTLVTEDALWMGSARSLCVARISQSSAP